MPENVDIRFTDGVIKSDTAPMSAPSDLANAHIDIDGEVRALNAPSAQNHIPLPINTRKTVFHAGSWLRLKDFTRRGERLFGVGGGVNEITDPYINTYGRSSPVPDEGVPYITDVDLQTDAATGSSIDADRYILYKLIPVNAREEAGPFYHAGFFTDTGSDLPRLTITASNEASYVEVYRTLEISETPDSGQFGWYYAGRAAFEESHGSTAIKAYSAYISPPSSTDTFDLGELNQDQTSFNEADFSGVNLVGYRLEFDYLLDPSVLDTSTVYEIYSQTGSLISIKEEGQADGSLSFNSEEIAESRSFPNKYGVTQNFLEAARVRIYPNAVSPSDTVESRFYDYNQWSITEDADGDPRLPDGEILNRTSNLYSYYFGELRQPEVKALHWARPVMYYGGVKWPTKRPEPAFLELGGTDNTTVWLQYEYETPGGKRFGPVREIQNCSKFISVVDDAEARLNIYVDDGGTTRLYARKSPDPYGAYTRTDSIFTFEAQASYSGITKDTDEVTEYISEEHSIFLSADSRPLEITFDVFSLPSGNPVDALFASRLSEAEGIASYTFYAATEEEIYAVQPQDRGAILRVVSPSVGPSAESYGYSEYTLINDGAVIIGVDGGVYLMFGRDLALLMPEDTEPWDNANSVAWDSVNREILIAADNGLWGFDIDRKAVVRHYDLTTDVVIWYGRSQLPLAYDVNTGWKLIDESGSLLSPHITTQPIAPIGKDLEIITLECDYDKSGYDPSNKSTWAEFWHVIRSDDVAQYSEVDSLPVSGKRNEVYKVPQNKHVHPVVKGRGHQIRIQNFDTLRSIELDIRLFAGAD